MTRLTVSADGQVTLLGDMLSHLGVEHGGKVNVEKRPNGKLEIRAAPLEGDIKDVFGLLKNAEGPTLSVAEMNEVIARGWAGKR